LPLPLLLQTDAVVGKREKTRLKELQKMKKQKIQEILDTQNAAIDADMVCAVFKWILIYNYMVCITICCYLDLIFFNRTIKGRDG
jgi:hypothetical protein